jgi:hypothetical protein
MGPMKKALSEDRACIQETVKPAAKGLTFRRLPCKADSVLFILRKEVIQPQVPLRLPCYDLVPVIGLTVGRRLQ